MRKNVLAIALLSFCIGTLQAQNKKKDREAIKKMCGCYQVTFNFAETFNYSKDSLYKPSSTKTETALEWAQLVVEDTDKVSIQHLLQVGSPAKAHIVKHWRQDWVYQNTDFYRYNADNTWLYQEKSKKAVKKQWTQKVYQVDDSPRYQGSGTWVHVDGKSYWENTTDAPLPRREYTKRSDYNITQRTSRHQITNYGWLHDQDNKKILRNQGQQDTVIAHEKGYNTYVKVPDARCNAAQAWWQKNKAKWQKVRASWERVYAKKTDLSLKEKVDHKPLYKHLFSEKITDKKQIDNVIHSFIKS